MMLMPLFFVLWCSTALVAGTGTSILRGVKVLITAPPSYADRLAPCLECTGATVLRCPTVVTELFQDGEEAASPLRKALTSRLESYDYVAFTSRRGIEAALSVGGHELVRRLNEDGTPPVAIALGADCGALEAGGVRRSSILSPKDASPNGIVQILSETVEPEIRSRTRVFCPVPHVTGGLREPSVVPNFLSSLRNAGFSVERCDAYRTRWVGPSEVAEDLIERLELGDVDVVAISSTAEVEGLLLLCKRYGVQLHRSVSVVAHGPVTAAGAKSLGVDISAISSDYSSFEGMRDAIASSLKRLGNDSYMYD